MTMQESKLIYQDYLNNQLPLRLVPNRLMIRKLKMYFENEILMDETPPVDIDNNNNEEIMMETVAVVELKKNKRDFEIANNLAGEEARKLTRMFHNSDNELIFNNKSNFDDWTREAVAAAGEFEINYIEQNFDVQEDAMVQQNNVDILPQMLTNNHLRDRYF